MPSSNSHTEGGESEKHPDTWCLGAPFIKCISGDMPGAACFPVLVQGCSSSSSTEFYKAPCFRLDFEVAVMMAYVCAGRREAVLLCFPAVPVRTPSSFASLGRGPDSALKSCPNSSLPVVLGRQIVLPAMVTALSKRLFKQSQTNLSANICRR